MKAIKRRYQSLPDGVRRGFWISLILFAGTLSYSAVTWPQLIQATSVTLAISKSIGLYLALLTLTGAVLFYFRRGVFAGHFIIWGVTASMLALQFTTKGFGYVAALFTFVLISIFASNVLPRKQAFQVVGAGTVLSITVLLLDLYLPYARQRIETMEATASNIVLALLVVTYAIIVIREYPNYSLQTKLIVMSVGIVIVPLVIISAYSAWTTRKALIDNANTSLVSTASDISQQIDSFITSHLDNIRVEAQYPEFAEYLTMSPQERENTQVEERALTVLNNLRRKDPIYISSYALLGQTGIDLLDTEPDQRFVTKADRDYYYNAMTQKLPYASEVRTYDESAGPSIYFSAPVRDSSGEIVGVLRSEVNASILQQMIVNSSLVTGDSYAVLLDSNGIILAHSSRPDFILKSARALTPETYDTFRQQKLLPDLPIEESSVNLEQLVAAVLQTQKQSFFQVELNPDGMGGELDQAGMAKLHSQSWSLVVAQPAESLLAPVEQQSKTTVLLSIFLSLMAAASAVVAARFMARPIVSMTGLANQAAQGDLSVHMPVETQDEIGTLAKAFNAMIGQLRGLIGTLEQNVADRTKALQASTEVSRRLSTILDARQLVREVVEQLQEAFGYYHAQIYLFDENEENLLMAGGTGEAGKLLLAHGHKIPRGKGLVGRAAESKKPVLVRDVRQEPGWLPNTILPDTRSEAAVPMILAGKVLGVLDVQHHHAGGLSQQDVDLLQAIANQVVIALRNAEAYSQAQNQAEHETMLATMGQKIQKATTIDEVLQVAVSELGRALGAKQSRVQLRNQQPSLTGKNDTVAKG